MQGAALGQRVLPELTPGVRADEDAGSEVPGMGGRDPGRHLRVGLLTSLALDPGACGMCVHVGVAGRP